MSIGGTGILVGGGPRVCFPGLSLSKSNGLVSLQECVNSTYGYRNDGVTVLCYMD